MVEISILMFLLLLLAAGVGDIGRAFHTYIVISNASREGARWASHYPWDEAGAIAAARAEAADSGVDLAASTVTITGLNGAGGEPIHVLVELPFDTIMAGIWGMGSLTLRSSTQMIIYGLDP
jgi:hypothetical protein